MVLDKKEVDNSERCEAIVWLRLDLIMGRLVSDPWQGNTDGRARLGHVIGTCTAIDAVRHGLKGHRIRLGEAMLVHALCSLANGKGGDTVSVAVH